MQVIAIPVQFRTVLAALAQGLDMAVTVADELPSSILRHTLHRGTFVCVFDPRHVKHRRLSEKDYYASEHVVVSYNGDLRGIVEDAGHKTRMIRCSVSSFANLGAIIDGSKLIATIPRIMADRLIAQHKHLRIAEVPFTLAASPLELLWPKSLDDDPACGFVRQQLVALANQGIKP
jgi:LysR family transcriptional activator of mexEF-oprN operon